jgi:hypothetical protein
MKGRKGRNKRGWNVGGKVSMDRWKKRKDGWINGRMGHRLEKGKE